MTLSYHDKKTPIAGMMMACLGVISQQSQRCTSCKLCYLEAIDLIVNCVEESFNQPGYQIYHKLETILLKACMQEELEEHLEAVCTFYKDDFENVLLTVSYKLLLCISRRSWLRNQLQQ